MRLRFFFLFVPRMSTLRMVVVARLEKELKGAS